MSAFQRMADEMERMFEEFGLGRRWGRAPFREEEGGGLQWMPDVEVLHRKDQLIIRADLPGLKKEEVTVEVADGAVVLQGERRRERESERDGVVRTERSYGSFYRTIPLPEGAATDQAKATYRDGVLEITMPAPRGGGSRRLEISESRTS